MRAQNHGLIAAALAVGLGAATCANAQQDYRLAFSKAENIEVFVEGATKDNWCAPMLGLRAVHGGAPDTAGLGRLLPRLGALFKQQCPQATAVSWRSVDAAGRQFAQGHSLAQDGWRMVATAPAPAAPPVAIAPMPAPVTPPVAVAPAPAPATPPVTVAPTPAPTAPPVAAVPAPVPVTPHVVAAPAPVPVAPPVAAAPMPTPTAPPAVTPPTSVPTTPPVAVAPAPVPTVPPVAAAPTPVPVAPPVTTPPAPVPAVTSPAPDQNFAVGGWIPPTGPQHAELVSFLTTMQDQNACKIVSVFNLGDQAAYVRLMSEGNITCGADGYAQGSGRLRLERSDGARVDRTNEVWLSHGLVFNQPVQGLSLASIAAVQKPRTMWLRMGSDPTSQSHYLLQADLRGNRIGIWGLVHTPVLTANTDAFRQAQSIRDMIDGVLTFAPNVVPTTTGADMTFADAAPGIFNRDADHLLYRIAARRSSSRNRGVTQYAQWRYDLSNGKNYLFEREARFAERKRQEDERKRQEEERLARQQQQEAERLARQKQLETERLARLERQEAERKERERINQLVQLARVEVRNLRQYQELLELEQQKDRVQALRRRLERDVSYVPVGPPLEPRSAYFGLMRNDRNVLQRIVRVDDSKDDDAVVDWPYPMLLRQQASMEKGWYWIRGERQLNRDELDDDGFPITLVWFNSVKDAHIHACEARGCSDLLTALGLMRMQLNQPDWTPQAAQAVIDEVPEDEKRRL